MCEETIFDRWRKYYLDSKYIRIGGPGYYDRDAFVRAIDELDKKVRMSNGDASVLSDVDRLLFAIIYTEFEGYP